MTHWRLADGTEVEICSWLDDHSRYLLARTAFRRVGGDDVVAMFSAAGDAYGWPAATLTDNGAVYAHRRVLAIVDAREVTVVALDTGEVLSTHLIEPHRGYWRNQRRDPGRWPRSRTTD